VSELQHLLPVQNQLGESPIWQPGEKALYWVDWGGNPIYRYEPATGRYQAFEVDRPVTALARRAAGSLVAISYRSLDIWDHATNEFTPVVGLADPERPQIIYNDAVVDRQGRLLVGTLNWDDPWAPEGSLYRLDPDGSLHQIGTGYATPNGLGLSPDGETLYLTDMRHRQILVYDYDTAAGTIHNRRLFVDVPEEQGMADGLIVDADGYIWSAHWEGWKLTRYDPQGKVEREIKFPVQLVICCAFGGDDLDDLYVTTAWWGFEEEQRKAQPKAGDLFRIKLDVKGLVEPAFKG
jgi:sugar lactone lactonase YvrE